MDIKCEDCGVFQDMADIKFTTTGFRGICKHRADCKTRQRLKSKEIINNASRRKMTQETPVVDNAYTMKLLCPECRDGKLTNCVGVALDPVTDDFVTCDTQNN